MGARADVLAIGTFKQDIKDCLDYPPEFYDDPPVTDGRVVLSSLFCCVTSQQSRDLADAFGIEPYNFNHHLLNPRALTAAKRRELVDTFGQDDMDYFDRLIAADFRMIYRPEG